MDRLYSGVCWAACSHRSIPAARAGGVSPCRRPIAPHLQSRASAKLCPPLSLQKPLCQRPAETDRDERPLGAAHQLMPGALPPRGTAASSSPGAWLPPRAAFLGRVYLILLL